MFNLTFLSVRKNSAIDFTLLVASANTKSTASYEFSVGDKKAKLTVEYGDFADALGKAAAALREVDSQDHSS